MSASKVCRSHPSEIFAHFFPSQSRKNETIQSFIKTLLPLLNQQWYLNTDRILHKIRSFKDQMKIETYEKCLNATQKYLNSRDFSVGGRYEVKKSWFFSDIQSYGETPRFQQLNSGLKALLKEVQPCRASWSESFRACWNGFIDCCSSAVSYTYNNPGKTACTFLALETAALAVRSYQQNSTFDASTSIVPWANSPESHWSCGSNLVFGLSSTLLTQNPIFVTTAGLSCVPMAYGQIVNGQIPNQLLNVGDSFSLDINMTELFNEPVTDVMMSQVDGNALPDWLNVAPMVVGSLATTNAVEVTVSDNIAYVADYTGGLRIIDISDRAHPMLIGSVETTSAYGVVMSGNIAYVADGASGLKIIDISDRAHPMGSIATTRASGVAVSGNIAYVADGTGGLRIIDVSDRAHPILKSSLPTTSASGVAVSGNIAYVADGASGLRIIDVSDPARPILKSSLPTWHAVRVAISGNIAYVADDNEGLIIIDVSDSAHPILKSSLRTTDAFGVAISGNFAYVTDGIEGLRIIDVSDNAHPVLKGSLPTSSASAVTISDNFAYVADSRGGLRIIDLAYFKMEGVPVISKQNYDLSINAKNGFLKKVSNSFSISTDYFPAVVNSIKTPQSVIPGGIFTLDLNVNHLFQDEDIGDTLSLSLEMQQSDTSLPKFVQLRMKPFVQSSIATTDAIRVAISDNMAYVADDNGGLRIIDVSDKAHPILKSSLPTTSAYGVAMSGNTAYVADGHGGLRIIDVSDKAHPVLKSTFSTSDASVVALSGSLAYVADHLGGLKIIDVSDSIHPVLKGSLATTEAGGVTINGNMAYVADLGGGLRIVDVSNSTRPILKGSLSTSYALGVAVDNNVVYVADGAGGLRIVDVSNSTHPILKGSLPTTYAWGVAVSGNMAYVADYKGGLRIIDVSDSANPILKGGLSTSSVAVGIAISSNFAYMPDVSSMKIVDLTNYQIVATPTTRNDEGNYELIAKATDSQRATASTPFTLRVEGAPRLDQPLLPQIALINQPFSWSIPKGSFSDPNGDTITYAAPSVPPFLKFLPSDATFLGMPGDSDKREYNITIFASDLLFQTSTVWNLFVHHAPTSKPIPNQVANIGEPFDFTVPSGTFGSPDGYPLAYSATLSSWLNFNNQTQTFKGIPQEADKGDSTLVVKVDDGLQGQAQQPFQLTVEHFPRLTKNFSSIYTAIGHVFSFNALSYFTDVDDEDLAFSSNAKGGLDFDNYRCTFSATFQSSDRGVMPLTLVARDPKGGSVAASFNITIDDYSTMIFLKNPPEVIIENRAPILVEPLLQQTFSADVGNAFSVKNSFGDPDNDELTFSADLGEASNWLTLDSKSGQFSGTPSSHDAATYSTRRYTIGVTARDPANKTAAGSFDILLQGPSFIQKILTALMWISGFAVASYGYYQKKHLLWNWCRKSKYRREDLYVTVGQKGITYKVDYPSNGIKAIVVTKMKDRCCVKRDSSCFDICKNTVGRTFPGGAKIYPFDWLSYDPKSNQFRIVGKGPSEQYLQEDIKIEIIGPDNRIMEQFTIKTRDQQDVASLPGAPFALSLKNKQPVATFSMSALSSSSSASVSSRGSLNAALDQSEKSIRIPFLEATAADA